MFTYLFRDATAILPDGSLLKNAYIGIADKKIVYVSDKIPDVFTEETIFCNGKIIMPGFYNCHTHMPMTLLRGYADDYPLEAWLFEHIFPAEAKLNGDLVFWGTQLALMESVRFGTVSVSDMYDYCDNIAQAVAQSGLKANLSRGITQFEDDFVWEKSEKVKEADALYKKWNNYDSGRIKIEASIHAEYTSSSKLWRPFAEHIANKNMRVHIHISETKKEHNECILRHGKTPVQLLDGYRVWENGGIAAHCVWVDDQDIRTLVQRNVSVVHNPVSNLKLASGVAPVTKMLETGVNVALGTDGMASNNSHNMFEEIKLTSLLQKNFSGDAGTMKAFKSLKLATENGAIAQNRKSGRLEVGYDADLILLDFDKPYHTPCYNPVSQIVYAATGNEVALTMVNGKILFKDGQYLTFDREKIISEVNKAISIF